MAVISTMAIPYKCKGTESKTCNCFLLPLNKDSLGLCYVLDVVDSLALLLCSLITMLFGLQKSGLMCRLTLTSYNTSTREKKRKGNQSSSSSFSNCDLMIAVSQYLSIWLMLLGRIK